MVNKEDVRFVVVLLEICPVPAPGQFFCDELSEAVSSLRRRVRIAASCMTERRVSLTSHT